MGRKKKKNRDSFEESTELMTVSHENKDNSMIYLDGVDDGAPVIVALVPPDMERCQCEWRDTTVETFGPKPVVRCNQEATVIAFQKRDPNEDVSTGAISLCDDHRVMIEHMYPGQCYFRRITTEKKIGDFA